MEDKKKEAEAGIETPEEKAAINAALTAQVKEQQLEIKKLKEAVKVANQGGRPVSTEPTEFKVGNKKYPFPAPQFTVPGIGTLTASEALKKPDVLKKLVELRAGNIE